MQVGDTCTQQSRRVEELRRAFQKNLKRKLTVLERAAMERAMRLTVRAEQAALDQSVPVDLVTRIDNSAQRAQRRLFDMIGAKRQPSAPSLAEYLTSRA